ncbi:MULTISPECIES: MFS transporter [Arthrobacter]|uniref:MFS transporter n=1 Tax=Arthrobacter terricola TaxID=2547396 RepID=A0A4R5KEM6_9MICC|nr:MULTISPECIES: MFS transporter [Arthrobacter]MBT8159728.1 MFS transporter [Arthrobacter sp. GN70]TDF93676.1 MFS transporter [Arthrobacter terricola]
MEAQTIKATPVEGELQARRVPHRWRNLMVLTGVSIVDNTEAGLTSTIFPSIAQALKLNSGHLGLLAALGKIVAVPAGPAWTWLAGRIGRRNTLVLITLVGGLFGAAAGFAHDFTQLLIFNALMSAAMVGGVPISNAILADSFDDTNRGKAVGYFYGFISLISSFVGPLIALFTGLTDGWRYGMWTIGGICALAGLLVAALYRDPGVGAAEAQLADLSESKRHLSRVTFGSVLSIMKVPSFSLMMVSRLLSGHLLIAIFGIQFLVTERHFSNAVAATVLVPFGLSYFAGTVGGGWFLALLDRVIPHRGRVAYLQGAQVFFAVAAFFGTQFHYEGIGIYAVFWGLMGFGQGLNPSANRSIVAAVILPELRGQAFAIFLTIFETIGWALFSLGAGALATNLGIQTVFFWIMVVLMLINAAVLTGLYRCYPRDVARVTDTLERRREEALERG